MQTEALLAALAVGALGGVHCVGMCGGIVSALSLPQASPLSRAADAQPRTMPAGLRIALYHCGRLGSYTLAGAFAGAVGRTALFAESILPVQRVLYAGTAVMLLLLGLYMSGATAFLAPVERAGAGLWRRISPMTKRFVPVRRPAQALALGALWGWVPCGLVYSVLATALVSGHPQDGALLMLAFGLGTLPHLVAANLALTRLEALRRPVVQRVVGVAIAVAGLWGLLHLAHGGHWIEDLLAICLSSIR